ncbi:MAG TPA: glycoside hydrolase family 3 C-terminal domain-containing protein [Jatrophihabitantaceae bacterium]
MSRVLRTLTAAVLVLSTAQVVESAPSSAAPDCPWVGSTAPTETKVARVLGQMTLDEKIQMLGLTASPDGYENYFPAVPRLCIPRLTLQDGPAGVAAGFTGVTQLPAPIDAAASFDPSVAAQYGTIQGSESWGKGIEVAQGPDVNIARVPQNGRTFEAYGEDPYLTAQTAVANIRAIQATGAMADVKHLAGNNQETNRQTVNDVVSDRTLHEIYLPAFEASVRDGDVATAMCAYNQVNGAYSCADATLMQDIFEDEFGFRGFIRSDFGAVHDVAASYAAGMDQSKPEHNAELKAAVQAGQVPIARIDDAVSRVLREMFRFKLFDHPPTGTPAAVVTSPQHAATARDIAEQGTVLLKNDSGVLPVSGATRSIAVIGPDGGDDAYTAGGGSSHVLAPYVVTPYQGIKARAGNDVNVTYTDGGAANGGLPPVPSSALTTPTGDPGLLGQYYANQTWTGSPVLTRTDPNVDQTWGADGTAVSPGPGVPAEHWSAKWTGTLDAPAAGSYTFSLTSDDGSVLTIDGRSVIDNGGNHSVQTRQGTVTLTAGAHQVEVDYFNNTQGDQVHLGWLPPGADRYAAAEQAARSSDLAVVFANDVESEGTDRPNLSLPGDQDGLIAAVAAANPNTVVVLNTGSAVTMPWLSSVKGVVESWYSGQEDGNAIAAVLFGDVNPSGKLPLTFPRSEADTPAHTPQQWPGVGGNADYSEGLQVGYRWYDQQGITPLYPFGYGLSYTTFSVGHLVFGPKVLSANGHETVHAQVTNTGSRTGAEVVQLYVGLPAGTGEPPRQLKGYQKVTLRPGETRSVSFDLTPRDLSYWDEHAHGWVMAGGQYQVSVGTSSADIAASGTFSVTKPVGPRYVTVSAPTILPPGATSAVTTSFTNDSAYAVHSASVALDVPAGWSARATTPASWPTVAPGQSVTTAWAVSAPAGADPGGYPLTATAFYQAAEGGPESRSGTASVSVPYPSTAAAFDNVGITDDSDHTPGNFDGSGNSYSAQALAGLGITPGSPVSAGGVTFTWPKVAAGTPDNVAMQGQLIALSGSGHALGLLGAAVSATQTGNGTVYYADGTVQAFSLSFPDWFSATPPPGDDLVATAPYLNRTNGKPPHTVSLFAAYVPLAAGKTVRAVALPNAGAFALHAFDIAID